MFEKRRGTGNRRPHVPVIAGGKPIFVDPKSHRDVASKAHKRSVWKSDTTQAARQLYAGSAHLEYQLTLQVARFAHAMCFAGVGELVARDRRRSYRTDVEEGKHPFKMGAVT
jgi:hypothetical protein